MQNLRKSGVRASAEIIDVSYCPPSRYALGVEVFTLADFRRRVSDAHLRTPQRVDFHLLIYFASGTCTHTIDFEPVPCYPGTLLVLHPGQVQRFDAAMRTWDGWIVMSGPQFLRETLTVDGSGAIFDLPSRYHLRGRDRECVVTSIGRMYDDARIAGDARIIDALLSHELAALFARLRLCGLTVDVASGASGANAELFRRFRRDVEVSLAKTHRVRDYATMADVSEKTLGRAVLAATGATAKAYLTRRVILEAKRLLANTSLPISAIAERLGYDEPSNFVKIFRREAGMAPGDFRRRLS